MGRRPHPMRSLTYQALVDRPPTAARPLGLSHGVATVRGIVVDPVGWADVATKRDLDHFATVLEAKLDAGLADVRTELHKEIGSLHQALGAQTRNLFLGLVGLQISGVTSAVVLSRVL